MEFLNFDSERLNLDIIYFLHFDYIISMTIPFKSHLSCQNSMYNCGIIGVES